MNELRFGVDDIAMVDEKLSPVAKARIVCSHVWPDQTTTHFAAAFNSEDKFVGTVSFIDTDEHFHPSKSGRGAFSFLAEMVSETAKIYFPLEAYCRLHPAESRAFEGHIRSAGLERFLEPIPE